MAMDKFLTALGEEIDDVDEEVFDLFSHSNSSQDLGMVDAKAEELELSISGRDFTIKQSPGLLQSTRAGGTTAAAVWKICIHLCEWLASSTNPLFVHDVLDTNSTVLELGSGISGLVPSILSPKIGRVIATDQQYALKLLQENTGANQGPPKRTASKASNTSTAASNVDVLPLDWEEDDTKDFLRSNDLANGVDAIIVCDCVFNYALIQPLVQTCTEICQARSIDEIADVQSTKPTFCIIAQQLRQPDVFEEWLRTFMAVFRVWRLPDTVLTKPLHSSSGFAVHVGVLRETRT